MYTHIHGSKHNSDKNMKLPKEKIISEFIIRIPRGSRVTVVHQNVPPVESEMRESVTKTWMLEQETALYDQTTVVSYRSHVSYLYSGPIIIFPIHFSGALRWP